jgi:NAD(P)H-hydrate epimerase
MRKILNAKQMRQVDTDTLERFEISSHDLMEQASLAFVGKFFDLIPDHEETILVVCGTGNNGGDGLAIARILQRSGYSNVSVLIFRVDKNESPDFSLNLRLLENTPVRIVNWRGDDLPIINENIIIDALLGIGLNRPLDGDLLRLVNFINQLERHVIAVDMPTGMRSDGETKVDDSILKADEVITFQLPKLSFFFPESVNGLERFIVVDIGLDEESIANSKSDYSLLEDTDISKIYRKRKSFSHKGTYGKALIIGGDTGTIGAALLCAEACLQAGVGLVTACVPEDSVLALNIRHPEVMSVSASVLEQRWDEFTAVAVGPGLGKRSELLKRLFSLKAKPFLLDADALNFLSMHKELLTLIPENTVLTPHIKEFDRLFGDSSSWWDRLQLAKEKAKEYKLVIVLKNQYTFIVSPNGQVYINPVGNPAMASGGMGDVLSGIVTAFLAQGYTSEEACILGCYLHGRAGDVLLKEGMAVIPASVLAAKIPFIMGGIK